jgi:FkbM family methyltransferase
MKQSIAILINGAIRNHVSPNYVFDVIDNLRDQFSFIEKVDIYFGTWKQVKNKHDKYTNEYYDYDESFLNKIKDKVDYFYTFDRPEDFDDNYKITTIEFPEESLKFYRMFYQIYLLCQQLEENGTYDYVCRCRNDLIIRGNFQKSIENIRNNISDYETSYTYWVRDDCMNDHFCITTQENYLKVWKNDKTEIYRMFSEWNETGEKLNLFKVQVNKINYNLFLPSYYLFKKKLFVENSKIQIKNINLYLRSYIRNHLCKYNNIEIYENANDILANYYLENKSEFITEEPHNKLLIGLKKFIEPISSSDIILGIDVGSCVGNYIKNIEDICIEKNKTILCFEPNPVNIIELEKIIDNKNNIKLFKCCLSNENKKDSFYNSKGAVSNFQGNQTAGIRSGGSKICDIDINRLDNILENEYPNQDIIIKFINIDIEGNDTNVIKGFEKYLPKTKYIIFEASDCLDDFRGPGIKNPMKDIVDFLSCNGFDTYRIGTKKLIKVNDDYWNDIYENVKFWSNCFSLKKDDDLINKLINENFDYIF